MGTLNKAISVTDTSSMIIPRYLYRREVTLRNGGTARVWFAINEDAVANFGLYIEPGETINYSKLKGESDIYAVCSSGETSTLYSQIA